MNTNALCCLLKGLSKVVNRDNIEAWAEVSRGQAEMNIENDGRREERRVIFSWSKKYTCAVCS
jgi:hypothetical protein